MNLYCSYLGPFVELKNPKTIKTQTNQDIMVCKNKGCSIFNIAKAHYSGSYCSTCGTKSSKEKFVQEIFPSISSMACLNQSFWGFQIVETAMNAARKIEKRLFLISSNSDDQSGKYVQLNNPIVIVNDKLIQSQFAEFEKRFLSVQDILKDNFESISATQFGWIKFEDESNDY